MKIWFLCTKNHYHVILVEFSINFLQMVVFVVKNYVWRVWKTVSSLSHTYNGCGENKRIIIHLTNKVFINFQRMSHKTKSNTEKFKHKSSNLRIQNSICQLKINNENSFHWSVFNYNFKFLLLASWDLFQVNLQT